MGDSTYLSARIARANHAKLTQDDDRVAIEEPLEIRIGKSPIAVTMRTPGHDAELAAATKISSFTANPANGISFPLFLFHTPDSVPAPFHFPLGPR